MQHKLSGKIGQLKHKPVENQNEIKAFEEKKVRSLWDTEKEKWYFSVVDVIAELKLKSSDSKKKANNASQQSNA